MGVMGIDTGGSRDGRVSAAEAMGASGSGAAAVAAGCCSAAALGTATTAGGAANEAGVAAAGSTMRLDASLLAGGWLTGAAVRASTLAGVGTTTCLRSDRMSAPAAAGLRAAAVRDGVADDAAPELPVAPDAAAAAMSATLRFAPARAPATMLVADGRTSAASRLGVITTLVTGP